MLAAERHDAILARLAADGRVVASEVVAALGVSDDTVRRDLHELAARGLLRRVHGGAMPAASALSFEDRREIAPVAKAALAAAALPLLAGAEIVLLDGGTTNLELARRLPPEFAGTVLTTSPPIAAVLSGHPRAEVVVIGGRLLKSSQVTIGPETIDAIRRVRPEVCVLGVCSLDPDAGLTTPDHDEAQVQRAMAEQSAVVVAVATADKLGAVSAWTVAPLADLTHVVTDGAAERAAPYAAAGLTVIRA